MRSPSLRFVALTFFLAFASTHARAAWPPAPGADMKDKANWPNDYSGRWNYLSYFADRPAGSPTLDDADLKLGAQGMSVDKAWTYTIGRDDTKIAVIDSGIKWDEADIVNKVALNAAELAKFKPNNAGVACTGLDGYDCNGDGRFDVSDYRGDSRIAPIMTGEPCYSDPERTKPGADRIKGDVNRNCILDAGDLIELFSDGVDDDANGYMDDIAGWDFFKNDNNPYDDTRYGHGTGEAKDSSAEANNGAGDPGTCPGCRFVPLRVGDSFIADSNDFGKAVIYAADNGANIVQEALGTVNQTAFSKSAIDYAYGKNVMIVASMADENSRHHNMPATANHVLTVHTVRFNDSKPESSSTFLAFDTCSNYGGHLSMSISGTSCSSEATGRGSGIAGLVFSMAKQEGITLTAEEGIQLFKMYADDIDVASSRGDNSIVRYYYSQPGFDQRFGYGRANAAKMMQAIKDRLIPPEVDLVSPEWFAPVHAASGGLVPVMGRVVATRAKAYDFRVQWAPGVQPEEADYRDLVAPVTNVPAQTVSGGTAVPLAQIDPKTIDTAHTADPDSPLGENDRSISIRVQAVAHYDAGDVKGEARRVISITNEKNGVDKELLPGFPVRLGTSIEGSPKLADIDGDGVRDAIVVDSAGRLHVYNLRGAAPTEVQGFPYSSKIIDGLDKDLTSEPTVPSYLAAPAYKSGAVELPHEMTIAAPAIADLDGDGRSEIVFTTWSGTIYVVDAKGKDLPGWPKRLPLVPSCPLDPAKPKPTTCMDTKHGFARGVGGAPVLADLDKDGKPEIILGGFDGNIWAYKLDGTVMAGFPVAIASKLSDTPSRIMTTPTLVDLNGDGIPDITTGSNQQIGGGGNAGAIHAIDGRGNNAPGGPELPNWPIVMTSLKLFPDVGEGITASQAAADFDGDGRPEIVMQGNGSKPLAVAADPGAQPDIKFEPTNRFPLREDGDRGFDSTGNFGEKTKAISPDVMFPLLSQPSVGDVDQDGVPDIVASGGSLSLAGALAGVGNKPDKAQHLLSVWSGRTGKMMPGSPIVIEDYTFFVNHAIADVSGDGYPEVITGTGGYFLHAADACGREARAFPKFTNGWITGTAAVGDVDGDKSLEVVVGTRDGYLFAWHTDGKESGTIEWSSFHHDNANTGNYLTKLDEGGGHAATPIDCSDPVAPPSDKFEAGGCACRSSGGAGSTGLNAGGWAGLALGIATLLRRSQRRDKSATTLLPE